MINAEFIQKIIDVSKTGILEIIGNKYTSKKVHRVYKDNIPLLYVNTLSGIVDYIKNRMEAEEIKKSFIHVDSYDIVNILKDYDPEKEKRDVILSSICNEPSIYSDSYFLENYKDVEDMIVGIKTKFVENEDSLKIIKLIGSVTDENSVELEDDGFTQKATVKKGIALKEKKEVPNILKLKPFRTFSEVDQPESYFIARLKSVNGVSVALYETKDEKWKLEAMKSIFDYLKAENLEINIIM